jgi:hypothetical protein
MEQINDEMNEEIFFARGNMFVTIFDDDRDSGSFQFLNR